MNPSIDEPAAPGEWVDDERCAVCGALYDDHRGDYGFSQAADRLRHRAKAEGDEGGGYRSRGAVLWVLHCMKLESWFMAHMECGIEWQFMQRAMKEDREPIPF